MRDQRLIQIILEHSVEGTNNRGRPRKEFIIQIMEDTGGRSFDELKRLAEDCSFCHSVVV